MTADRIWHILGKKLSGEATEEELYELTQLLREHPELHYPIQNITDLWKLGKPVNDFEARQALQMHLLRLGETGIELPVQEEGNEMYSPGSAAPAAWRYRALAGIAATIMLGLLSYFLFFTRAAGAGNDKKQELPVAERNAVHGDRNSISTKTGSQSKIVLPDGSTVWLNAGSTIEYNKSFDKDIREVSLNGEAYFDVTKDTGRPFIIHTQKINIKVLGTAFNVKSYENDTHSETSLIHGSIEVTMKDRPEEKIIMKPSEKLTIRNDAVSLTKRVNAEQKQSPVVVAKINLLPADGTIMETSWMENRFVFRDKKFVDLAHEMERKYGFRFWFENEEVQQLMFSGNFKNETIEQILQALQLASYFNYAIDKNNVITITP
ncbi:MAG: FecR family protein [Chitinophagaceae bacterium]|nr:FecR family protein [Chitinophagaceae bacterium]